MNEVTLLPADTYKVINKSILSDVDRKYLLSFYSFFLSLDKSNSTTLFTNLVAKMATK